jgi:hypothetical protein
MTRTARASFPRAILKDRSESKSGHRDDKHVRKDGAGAHGWGSLADEKAHEEAGLRDEQLEFYEELNHEEYRKPGVTGTSDTSDSHDLLVTHGDVFGAG